MPDKHSNELINKLLKTMEERKKKFTDLSKETGIPKDRMYKWVQQGNNPKAEDERVLYEWITGDKSEDSPIMEDVSPASMQILNKLSNAYEEQAKAMNLQAEANKQHAENYKELINLIKETNSKINLDSILKNQDAGLGLIIELLKRDVHREVEGNKEKEKGILAEIVQRIAPDFARVMKQRKT